MSLVRFWWHGDIQGLQQDLLGTLAATNIAVTACTALDPTTLGEWQTWYAGAYSFATTDAAWLNTGTQADLGQQYQRELYAWQQRLSKTCSIAVPAVDPDKNQPDLTGVNQALRYAAIIAGFLGTAYIVGKAVEVLPKRAASK